MTPQTIPDVSVVIPVRNGEGSIRAVLDAIAERLRADSRIDHHEVVVVDDASDDASAQEATRIALNLPQVRVIPLHERHGPGYAARVGLLAAAGRLRILLPTVEGDVRPAGAWEEALNRVRTGAANLVVGRFTGVLALDSQTAIQHVEDAVRHGRTWVAEVVALAQKAGLKVDEMVDQDPRAQTPGPPFVRVLKGVRDLLVELHWPWAGVE